MALWTWWSSFPLPWSVALCLGQLRLWLLVTGESTLQLQGVWGHTIWDTLLLRYFFLPLCLPEPSGPWTKYFSSMIGAHQWEEIFALYRKKKALGTTPDFCQCPRL